MKLTKIVSALLAAIILLLSAACGQNVITGPDQPGSTEEQTTERKPFVYTPGEGIKLLTAPVFVSTRQEQEISDEFKKNYASFSLELLSRSAGGKTALVSPLSVLTAMLMTANGAKGETLAELEKVLGGGMPVEEMNAQLYSFFETLCRSEKTVFESANSVWVTDSPSFHVDEDFIKLVENTFRAEIAEAPFTEPATVDAINDWCAQHTDNMIKKVLEYTDVSADTVMVLINALCFEALWRVQYEDHQISDRTFNGEKGTKAVKMMYSEESGYIKGEHETGFIKYYEGNEYAFMALLPESGMKMEDYLKTLTGERFVKLAESRGGAVKAGIPQFKLDWSASLVDVLAKMGIELAFTTRSDLSGLGYDDSGYPLYISDVIHKTHIEVDNAGTKAAAVTAVIVNKATAVYNPTIPPEVILDRPFVYAIVDTETMLPVFIGCVTDF